MCGFYSWLWLLTGPVPEKRTLRSEFKFGSDHVPAGDSECNTQLSFRINSGEELREMSQGGPSVEPALGDPPSGARKKGCDKGPNSWPRRVAGRTVLPALEGSSTCWRALMTSREASCRDT